MQVEDRRVAGAALQCTARPATSAVRSAISTGAVHTITRSWPTVAGCARSATGSAGSTGGPCCARTGAPVDELVLTVLSQNTNDRNRDVAYGRLRERFSSWAEVRDAPVAEVEDAIRPGGLAPTKAVRIKQILGAIGDDDLAWMEDAPLEEARDYLCDLPGVGRKTAACVLLFSYGRPDVPVDTHVYRVGTRLGLWPERTPLERGARRACCGSWTARGRVRDPRAPDPPRPPHLHRAQPRLRGLPAQADVPRRAAAARRLRA